MTTQYDICTTCGPAISNDDWTSEDLDMEALTGFLKEVGQLALVGKVTPAQAQYWTCAGCKQLQEGAGWRYEVIPTVTKAVRDLYVKCSFPLVEKAIAASDTCQRPAMSTVESPKGSRQWRCEAHMGLYDAGTVGKVRLYQEQAVTDEERTYTVALTGNFEARSPEDAAQQFKIWLDSGRVNVTVVRDDQDILDGTEVQMTKAKTYEFEVSGYGRFPIDMLRYDGCFPCRGQDATTIEYSDRNRKDDNGEYRQRRVRLRGSTEPTVGRWDSFGWTVDNVRAYGA